MAEASLIKRRYWIFYILVGYILAVFFWWWILLFQKNDDLFREKVQLLYYRYQQENSALAIEKNEALMQEYHRQRWMIIGEGVTFILLLGIGIYRLRRTILKEVELAKRQRNFLLSITHELKSPLASAHLNLQTIASRVLSKEQITHLLGNTTEDIHRLNELVEKILLASKMDHANLEIHREVLNLSDLVTDCREKMLSRYAHLRLESTVKEDVHIKGDAVLLKSLINNLLENAVKYSPKDAKVLIDLHQDGPMALLDIGDEGKDIPIEEQEKIFERFYRIGNEETRTNTGVGLGLFIVQQVASLHHGKVEIVQRSAGGKIFRVHLPLSD